MSLLRSPNGQHVKQEGYAPVAHKFDLVIRLLCHINATSSQGLAVNLTRRIDQLTSVLVYLPMLEDDQASDRKRTKEVRGSRGVLDPVSQIQQHLGRRN